MTKLISPWHCCALPRRKGIPHPKTLILYDGERKKKRNNKQQAEEVRRTKKNMIKGVISSHLAKVRRKHAALVVEPRALHSLEQLEQVLRGALQQNSRVLYIIIYRYTM